MFVLYADKSQLSVQQQEPIASGAVNVYTVQFAFSSAWTGLTKTAVFKVGVYTFSVPLAEAQCTIPREALTTHGQTLYAGVYGTQGGTVVLPTVWVSLGRILEGVALGASPPPMEVLSFNGRSGDVMPEAGDYTPAMIGMEPLTNEQLEEILQ